MEGRREYALHTEHLAQPDREVATRTLLEIIAPDACTFETDVHRDATGWTALQEDAADRLLSRSTVRGRHRDAEHGYFVTGVLDRADVAAWEAFLVMAPLAYDASVWAQGFSSYDDTLISINDESLSVVVSLDDRQLAQARTAIHATTLHPWQPPGRRTRR